MAINIVLYHSNLERTRVDKTLALSDTNKTTIQGTLKEECDLLYPVIMVEFNSVPTYNYMYISAFNRYYFIDKIVCVQNNLYRLHCTVDVLMSWKSDILNLSPYVSRNETEYTTNLSDDIYGNQADVNITPILSSSVSGDWFGTDDIGSGGEGEKRWIVQVQGRPSKGTGTPEQTYVDHNYSIPVLALDKNGFKDFAKKLSMQAVEPPIQDSIVSAYLLPIEPVRDVGSIDRISIVGGGNFNDITFSTVQDLVLSAIREITWTFDITHYTGENAYKNYAPYRKYLLSFLPFGELTLDSNIITGSNVYVKATVDCYFGDARLYYRGKTTDEWRYLANANVAKPLPFSSTNIDVLKAGTGVITSALGVGASIATGNVLPAVIGAVGGLSSTVQGFTPSNQNKQGAYNHVDDEPTLYVYDTIQTDKSPSLYGRPLNKVKQLSTLVGKGLTICNRVHLENIPATSNEQNTIEQLLTTGIIL